MDTEPMDIDSCVLLTGI